MTELNLNVKTQTIGGIYIEDLVKQFGWRIRKAVLYEDGVPKGLIGVEIIKLIRWWKFWNRDIKAAYLRYTGIIWVPWTIKLVNPTIIEKHQGVDWETELQGLKPMTDNPLIDLYKPNHQQRINEDDEKS
jgi:hypothetical protein